MPLTYYLQSCPTCGRRLQIRIEYLGRQVICYHCNGSFIALDSEQVNHHSHADYCQPHEPTLCEPLKNDYKLQTVFYG